MALTAISQVTDGSGLFETEDAFTPAAGSWLVAVVTLKVTDGSTPLICVADYARNVWSLVYSKTQQASARNSGAGLLTQVWVAPAVQWAGWPSLRVYTSCFPILSADVASSALNIFEIGGMGNGFLTVDSVTVGTATGATSMSLSVPAPAANCLMVAGSGTDNTTGSVSVTSAGWNVMTAFVNSGPAATMVPMWRESASAQTASWSSTVATNWAAVAVAIRATGVGPSQPNPNWPAVEFQVGLGWRVTDPISSVTWTTVPNRLLSFSTQRGYQYELGSVQSSPTDLEIRNDDGVFTPTPNGSGTATANGTTTTLLVSSTDAATLAVGDFFRLKTSGGVLKETTVFQITQIGTGGTTTVTFINADGSGGGALVSTATGDLYSPCPIDLYVPYRVMAAWNNVRYPVCTGWVERWPQTWRDPHWGSVPAVGIDTIATLTAADMTMVQGEILARRPQSYWPLSDAAGATQARNWGTGSTPLVQTNAPAGMGANGAAQFGTSTQDRDNPGYPYTYGISVKNSLMGDAGTGWSSGLMTATEYPTMGSALVGSPGNNTTFPSITNGVTIMGYTYATANEFTAMTTGTVDPTRLIIRNSSGTGAAATQLKLAIARQSGSAGTLGFTRITVWDKTTHATTSTDLTSTGNATDGAWEFWAISFNATNWTFYTAIGTSVFSQSGTCNLGPTFGLIDIGGESDSTSHGQFMNATHAHIAIFPRRLSAGEMTDLAAASWNGKFTYAGTNDSIARRLAYVNWTGSRALTYTNYTNGTDTTPASTVAEKIAALADYEGGKLFSDATGTLQFRGREKAALQTVRAVLGDRPDLGEIPYEGGDSLQLDYDPTFIYNQVSVTDAGVVISDLPAPSKTTYVVQDPVSIAQYGVRTLGKDVSFDDGGAHALGMANYYLTQYAYPRLRLATVMVSAAKASATVPATWPFVLSVEVGDLVTFNRRPIGAPAISIKCIVLNVQHTVAPDQWDTTLTLGVAP
ncbi:MAG: hypothetical protein JWP34_5218 [Massilia sp.]|nr:hypothetical protein [Massilia sp.]